MGIGNITQMDYVPIFYWVSIDDLNLIIVIRPQLPPQPHHLLVQILKLGQKLNTKALVHLPVTTFPIYLDSLACYGGTNQFRFEPGITSGFATF